MYLIIKYKNENKNISTKMADSLWVLLYDKKYKYLKSRSKFSWVQKVSLCHYDLTDLG